MCENELHNPARKSGRTRSSKLPLIFLQYWPVLCKISGNLSERIFRLELDLGFVMANTLNYNHKIKQFD